MEVLKKDGRVELLDKEKIKISILSSISDSKELLNESDVEVLVDDIVKRISGLRSEYGNTSSYEIIGVIIDILKRDGFDDIINKYVGLYNR